VSDARDGIYVTGHPNGFRITVPADTTPRSLRMYAGLYGSAGTFRAWLGDHGAAPFVDRTLSSVYGSPGGVYTLNYRAASSGQALMVEFSTDILFDSLYGNVSFQAATLAGAAPDNLAPTITLTQPADNDMFDAPADILIVADATDTDGAVAVVEYFANGEKLGETTAVPHEFAWNGVAAGTYDLTARATDDDGDSATSASVTVTVETVVENQPPTVTLIQPADNGTFEAPATIVLEAEAMDADGTVVRVEFHADGTKIGEVTESAFTFSWEPVAEGGYLIRAVAVDDKGAETASEAVEITVTAPPDEEIHLVDAGMEDGQITFSFSSREGTNYTIWYTESFLEVSWQMLTQVSGNGGMLTITDDPGLAAARYYRVSRE
jgi:hypothetical protein